MSSSFNIIDFVDQANLYNNATKAYDTLDAGITEQLARKGLKIMFQSCSAAPEKILSSIEAKPNSEVCESVKNRIRYEWFFKYEKGIESPSTSLYIPLDDFIRSAVVYSKILTQSEQTPEFKKWRESLKSYKSCVEEAKQNGINTESLVEILKENEIESGPAVGKLPYWQTKSQ